jgi:hypothetical protein
MAFSDLEGGGMEALCTNILESGKNVLESGATVQQLVAAHREALNKVGRDIYHGDTGSLHSDSSVVVLIPVTAVSRTGPCLHLLSACTPAQTQTGASELASP